MSQQLEAPSSSTVVAISSQEPIAMTRESTLAPTATLTVEPSSKLEEIRRKFSPLLLYVVSTAQFLDIGKFHTNTYYFTSFWPVLCVFMH